MRAQQQVDWTHGIQHLWAVGNAVYGEATPAATDWVDHCKTHLWDGQVEVIVAALHALHLDADTYPDIVQQAPEYFGTCTAAMRYADFRALG